nr:sce7726 family protein [Blastocatellia bacterium]
MNDKQLRHAVKTKVLERYAGDPETRILDELGLRHGAARIDIAVVNGILHGFELKSDMDSLKRLPHQVQIYSSVLDKVTLVVGRRHEHDVNGQDTLIFKPDRNGQMQMIISFPFMIFQRVGLWQNNRILL